jgi:hypothetical protein
MSHLSRSEIVDLAEEALPRARAVHVETCAACREQADAVRAALRDARAVEVPEPSPLFWQQFQARVRDSVARDLRPAWDWIDVGGAARLAAALVVLIVVGIAVFAGLTPGPRSTIVERVAPRADRSSPAVPGVEVADPTATSVVNPDEAEVWAVLAAAAADVRLEEAHAVGMHVYPGTIDYAVQRMSAAELNELGRLLQREMKHSMD